MAIFGEAVFLQAAGWLVGNGHFYQARAQDWSEDLVPELGSVGSVRDFHQIDEAAL